MRKNRVHSKLKQIKKHHKSKYIRYQEKMDRKIREEFNIKKSKKETKYSPANANAAASVYGERMFMNKYKSRPKFMENLNSTFSPQKEKKQ